MKKIYLVLPLLMTNILSGCGLKNISKEEAINLLDNFQEQLNNKADCDKYTVKIKAKKYQDGAIEIDNAKITYLLKIDDPAYPFYQYKIEGNYSNTTYLKENYIFTKGSLKEKDNELWLTNETIIGDKKEKTKQKLSGSTFSEIMRNEIEKMQSLYKNGPSLIKNKILETQSEKEEENKYSQNGSKGLICSIVEKDKQDNFYTSTYTFDNYLLVAKKDDNSETNYSFFKADAVAPNFDSYTEIS